MKAADKLQRGDWLSDNHTAHKDRFGNDPRGLHHTMTSDIFPAAEALFASWVVEMGAPGSWDVGEAVGSWDRRGGTPRHRTSFIGGQGSTFGTVYNRSVK